MENVETYRNVSLVERLTSYFNNKDDDSVTIILQVGSSSIVCSSTQNVGKK